MHDSEKKSTRQIKYFKGSKGKYTREVLAATLKSKPDEQTPDEQTKEANTKAEVASFNMLDLKPQLLSDLEKSGYTTPTPIQSKSIPVILQKRDLIGQAQTGTGKTAAFGIPIINAINERPGKPVVLIMIPTRELALQVTSELQKLSRSSRVKVLAVYGGESIEKQIRVLRRGVHVIVGTPGRLQDHIERRTLRLDAIKTVVLDEADEMLNMGFIDDMERILSMIPETRQTLLFSATFSSEILSISAKYLKDPVSVNVASSNSISSKVKQIFYRVSHYERRTLLMSLVDAQNEKNNGFSLVFCKTKKEVDNINRVLCEAGFESGALHGDYSQSQRDNIMRKFRAGRLQVLVATDVASRGIDVKDVRQVINYCIPKDPKSYIHRIGRTARIGNDGVAITMLGNDDSKYIRPIERLTRKKINVVRPPATLSKFAEKVINSPQKIKPESSIPFNSFSGKHNRGSNNYKRKTRSAAVFVKE